MAFKIDFNKIRLNNPETLIEQQKTFFKKHLLHFKNRNEILEELKPLALRFTEYANKRQNLAAAKDFSLMVKVDDFLEKYFEDALIKEFNKKIEVENYSYGITYPKEWYLAVLMAFATSVNEVNENVQKKLKYQSDYLNLLYSTLLNYGLHPNIYLRDKNIHATFNLQVIYKQAGSKEKFEFIKTRINKEELYNKFFVFYENKKPLQLKGKIIQFSKIDEIKITQSLLKEDEIELYALSKNIEWNANNKDEKAFLESCEDVTEKALPNPIQKEISKPNNWYKNQSGTYVHQSRIEELKKIQKPKMDLSKLIKLCEGLNSNAENGNSYFVISGVRFIFDHVPTLFGYKNFSTLVAQHKFPSSVKQSLVILENNAKNIADFHIHDQMSNKNPVPNITQVDFSRELDVLLSEVIKAATV